MKILYKREMPLLSRTRVGIEIEHPGKETPSKSSIKKEVASILKVKEELISIRHIYSKYGKTKSKVIVHIYNTLEDLKRIEGLKEEPKKEEKPQEQAPVQEAPKPEEKKKTKQ
jgi:ribosomal protein S24E